MEAPHITNFARPLETPFQVSQFLRQALGIDNEDAHRHAVEISRNEMVNGIQRQFNTLKSARFRLLDEHQDIEERKKLWIDLAKELVSLKRLDDEAAVGPNKGGVLPKEDSQFDGQAFIVIGPPASGKSGFAAQLADQYGAAVLDNDIVKPKIPEYADGAQAAAVHDEADAIMFGDAGHSDFKPVLIRCLEERRNIVIPKIGRDLVGLRKLRDNLAEKPWKYDCHLVLIALDRVKAARRAFKRFVDGGRYVPLAYAFDAVGNEPVLNYYRTTVQDGIGKRKGRWRTSATYTTDVAEGGGPVLLCCSPKWNENVIKSS